MLKNRILKYLQESSENNFSHAELLSLWEESIRFANKVCLLTSYFPKSVALDIDARLREASFRIFNYLAKANRTHSREEFEICIHKSIESVSLTISCLLIAHQWNYVRKDLYAKAFQDGHLLVKRLQTYKDKAHSV
jgi:four helix bundle protein